MVRSYFLLHLVVLIWAFTSILGKVITIPAVELVFYRTLLATLFIGLWMRWRGIPLTAGRKGAVQLVVTGLIIGVHWMLFFLSTKIANPSICLVGIATGSLWVALFEPLYLKDKSMEWLDVFFGLVVIGCLYIVFYSEFQYQYGLMIAVASAIAAAVFSVFNGTLAQAHNNWTVTFYEMLGACLATVLCFPLAAAWSEGGTGLQLVPNWNDAFWIVVLSLVCTVWAYDMYVRLLRKLSVFAISLTSNFEPVYGIILAALILKDYEKLTLGFYAGAAGIALTVLIYPILKGKNQPTPVVFD